MFESNVDEWKESKTDEGSGGGEETTNVNHDGGNSFEDDMGEFHFLLFKDVKFSKYVLVISTMNLIGYLKVLHIQEVNNTRLAHMKEFKHIMPSRFIFHSNEVLIYMNIINICLVYLKI